MKNAAIITHFRNQAKACQNMGSPFTATLCHHLIKLLDETTKTGQRIENWPGDTVRDALALRLCGGLHSIVISGRDDPLAAIYPNYPNYPGGEIAKFSQILAAAIATHDETLSSWLNLPPQTNETGRSAALLPGLLQISRQSNLPLQLCEVGTSAGLNLQLDQFFYSYGDSSWGDPTSPVSLNPEMKGETPDLSGDLEIASRIGCDLSPIDIRDAGERLRLRSYIWPDQPFRTDRLNGAIKLAKENPPQLLKMEAADFVEQQLAERPNDTAFVLMHSVVWQYLPPSTKQRIRSSLEQWGSKATASNPIFWLRLEGLGGKEPDAGLLLDTWPNHSETLLARACYHGSWVNFL